MSNPGHFAWAGYTMWMATINIQHAMAARHQPSGEVSAPALGTRVVAMLIAIAMQPSVNKTWRRSFVFMMAPCVRG